MVTITDTNVISPMVFDPLQGFYPASTAARLAQAPYRTVKLWDKKGIVTPVVQWVDDLGKETFGYTFEGLVYLRLIRMLRDMEHPFPLRKVIATIAYLRKNFGPPGRAWADARIVSKHNDMWVTRPVVASASRAGQMPFKQWLGREFEAFTEREDALLIPFQFTRWVEIKPVIRNGMPVVKGTGIETATIHAAFNRGLDTREVKSQYPFLTPAQINHSEEFERFLDTRAALQP